VPPAQRRERLLFDDNVDDHICYQYVSLFARYAAEPDMLPGFTRERFSSARS